MLTTLEVNSTTAQREEWLRNLARMIGIGFHPDTLAHDYVNNDGTKSFTDEECDIIDAGLMLVFARIDDPYAIAIDALGFTNKE